MSDLTDVLNTLATLISDDVVYPRGTSNPSIVGVDVTIAPGWPIRNNLDDAMKGGKAIISVFPDKKETPGPVFERNSSKTVITPATIAAQVLNNTITITGTVSIPQVIVTTVDGVNYPYTLLNTDTVNSIAASIAALIPSASAVGNVITITNYYSIKTSISTQATSTLDLGWTYRYILICCWCPTPQIRSKLGSYITVYFRKNYRILLPDNFYANVWYMKTDEVDYLETQDVFRRDIVLKVLYSTTEVTDVMTSAAIPINLDAKQGLN